MPFYYKDDIRRYLGMKYVNSFPWLAISAQVRDVSCSLFSGRKTGGRHHNSGGQVLSALVQRPLIKFHNMTGKFGDLSAHNKKNRIMHAVKSKRQNFFSAALLVTRTT